MFLGSELRNYEIQN